MSKIRNIIQTNQEREVVKTAPDMVVYFEGLPFLKNSFLTTNPNKPVLVNFNDHFQSFNATYDTDQGIPSCTITLVVPAHLRYLYQMPGGNNIVQTMMQVQVFCKGYYYATNGNTLYHRVFKGVTSYVTHADDGKALTITIQCRGILMLFEKMQIDASPALMSSSGLFTTPFKNVLASMSPYLQMAFAFLYPSLTDGFYVTSITQAAIQNTPYFQAVQNNYIAKWQSILADMCRETHIYGLRQKDVKQTLDFLNKNVKRSSFKGSKGWNFLASEDAYFANIKESDQVSRITDNAKIRHFLPDFTTGNIQLVNGSVTSRLELLRIVTRLVNYELYQDVDGQIIIKPALYNLDVTNLGDDNSGDANQKYAKDHPNNDITQNNNPFVTRLSEITDESETEDQSAVQATRMAVNGKLSTTIQVVDLDQQLKNTAEYIDIPKLAQFGLRQEPVHHVPWIQNDDNKGLFANAASEMALANRGYRTYSFSMPLKPELKLGFPMYVAHRDMYGYIKQISIQFAVGGRASMSVTLDTLRKRPLYPQAGADNQTVFQSQPNMVLKWGIGVNDPTTTTVTNTAANPDSSPANLKNVSLTLPRAPSAAPLTADQASLIAFQQAQLGSYFSISNDTTDKSWRIQPDTEEVWTNPRTVEKVKGGRDFYADIRTTIPYTDGKGYEVVAPFPWGRYIDIKTALQEFTRDGYVYRPSTDVSGTQIVQNAQAFITMGLATPTGTDDPAQALSTALTTLQQQLGVIPNAGTPQGASSQTVQLNTTTGDPVKDAHGNVVTANDFTTSQQNLLNVTIFELSFTQFLPGGADSIISTGQPDLQTNVSLLQDTQVLEQTKVNVFITGLPPQPGGTFATEVKAIGNKVGALVEPLQPE